MEIINKGNFEFSDNLAGEFIGVIKYASETVLNVLITTVTIIYKSDKVITFDIAFDREIELEGTLFRIDMVNELKSFKIFLDNQVFEGDKGWYIFHGNTFTVINVKPFSVLASIDIDVYPNLDEANKAITRSIQQMCRMSYKDYKQTCEGLWNLKQDDNVSTKDALDIFENLGSCISKRSVNLKECPIEDITSRTGHEGAIFKLRRIQTFYGNLIIKRIRDDMK